MWKQTDIDAVRLKLVWGPKINVKDVEIKQKKI